jgi:hypothetical protein
MTGNILLLGDLKGTKAHLEKYLANRDESLTCQIAALRNLFGQVVLRHLELSRSFHATVFSDSVLVEWSDVREGSRFCVPFAVELFKTVSCHSLPFRLFVDKGIAIPMTDDIAKALATTTERFSRIMPVSTATWSVFLAEASHFPEGVFLGISLLSSLHDVHTEKKEFEAGPFSFFKLILS